MKKEVEKGPMRLVIENRKKFSKKPMEKKKEKGNVLLQKDIVLVSQWAAHGKKNDDDGNDWGKKRITMQIDEYREKKEKNRQYG